VAGLLLSSTLFARAPNRPRPENRPAILPHLCRIALSTSLTRPIDGRAPRAWHPWSCLLAAVTPGTLCRLVGGSRNWPPEGVARRPADPMVRARCCRPYRRAASRLTGRPTWRPPERRHGVGRAFTRECRVLSPTAGGCRLRASPSVQAGGCRSPASVLSPVRVRLPCFKPGLLLGFCRGSRLVEWGDVLPSIPSR